jgi:hypothetical protein
MLMLIGRLRVVLVLVFSFVSSLLSLMVSTSPSSESEKSKDACATSLSGVFALAGVSLASWRISGSSVKF